MPQKQSSGWLGKIIEFYRIFSEFLVFGLSATLNSCRTYFVSCFTKCTSHSLWLSPKQGNFRLLSNLYKDPYPLEVRRNKEGNLGIRERVVFIVEVEYIVFRCKMSINLLLCLIPYRIRDKTVLKTMLHFGLTFFFRKLFLLFWRENFIYTQIFSSSLLSKKWKDDDDLLLSLYQTLHRTVKKR